MTANNVLLEDWERAEIRRSAIQANLTGQVSRTSPRVIARYANPPEHTAYPLEYALHRLGNATGKLVLDLGCGGGEFTNLVAARGAKVIGLDISTDLLQLARARMELDGFGKQVHPTSASAHAIPLRTGSVDVVFGMAVLHHLDLRAAAQEVHRVLKPGGRAIFKEPVRNSRVLTAMRAAIPYRQPDVSPFERPLRTEEVRTFASTFRTFSMREFELPFISLLRFCGVLSYVQRSVYRFDRAALDRVAFLRGYGSVVVFEVTK